MKRIRLTSRIRNSSDEAYRKYNPTNATIADKPGIYQDFDSIEIDFNGNKGIAKGSFQLLNKVVSMVFYGDCELIDFTGEYSAVNHYGTVSNAHIICKDGVVYMKSGIQTEGWWDGWNGYWLGGTWKGGEFRDSHWESGTWVKGGWRGGYDKDREYRSSSPDKWIDVASKDGEYHDFNGTIAYGENRGHAIGSFKLKNSNVVIAQYDRVRLKNFNGRIAWK